MGSGKSTLGPPLAQALNLGYADLDEEVAARARRSVADIFAAEGETAFRRLESAVLRATEPGCVYSLGGGALTFSSNLAWILRHGLLIYLKVTPEELHRRLIADPAERPLLCDRRGQRLAAAPLMARVRNLLEARRTMYEQAHIILCAMGDVAEVVQRAADAISAYEAASRKVRR